MGNKRHQRYILLLAVTALGWLPAGSQPVVPAGNNDYAAPLRGQAPSPFVAAARRDSPAADLEVIRQRVIADLLEPAVNEAGITRLLQAARPDGTWPGINYQDVSRTGFQHSQHLENMLDLSRAYKKAGGAYAGNPVVKKTVAAALDFWLAHDFICDNWWWNEMGTPQLMINILLVLDTDLTEKQRREGLRIAGRANLNASGARPGGDLIQIAGMLGKQALLTRDTGVLAKVVEVMASEIKITTGRGLKPDLSFHHRTDNVISTLAYGTGYASSFAYWAVKGAGTQYALPDTAMKLLVDYFLDGICQSMVYGRYPDPGARNRDLSRQDALAPAGTELARNLLAASSYRKQELAAILKIRQGKQAALSRTHFFWHSEYFTHQKPGYFVSVRMHSDRGNNIEEPHNEEGLKNHHLADGANFISPTGREYNNIFPVWDWQKIPGTTVVQKPALPPWKQIAKKGRSSFVGGVTDGEYGAAAFDFTSVHDPLKARKAWFFFDQEYVSLGAGISAEADYPVATTLNQCLLSQQVVIQRDNRQEPVAQGDHTLTDVTWVAHANIAYLFDAPTTLHLQNAPATGSWQAINHQAWATKQEVQQEVFKLWLDHGTKPRNATYAYTVVPNLAPAAIAAYRQNAAIVILANSPEIQAVTNRQLHCSQAVFYQAGTLKLAEGLSLTAASPCMVMVKAGKKGVAKITVSDPSRKLSSLELVLTTRFEGAGDNWQATWNKQDRSSSIRVRLPGGGRAGESVVLARKS